MPMPDDPYIGKLFTIPPEIIQIAKDGFDDAIFQFGKPCQLFFPNRNVICPNCILNKDGRSSGRYKTGGPIPFDLGEICPVCEGTGKIAGSDNSYITTFKLDWTIKPWMSQWGGSQSNADQLRIPGGFVTTKGFVEDIVKVARCDYCVMDINTAAYNGNKFKLLSIPVSPGSIVKNRYFEATWSRLP